jgi:hypothetical protein
MSDTCQQTGPGPDYLFAWYASRGKVTGYFKSEGEYQATEMGDGNMAVVVRDRLGGVAWRTWKVTITP